MIHLHSGELCYLETSSYEQRIQWQHLKLFHVQSGECCRSLRQQATTVSTGSHGNQTSMPSTRTRRALEQRPGLMTQTALAKMWN